MPSESLVRTVFTATILVFGVLWLLNYRANGRGGNTFYSSAEGPLLASCRTLLLLASLGAITLYLVDPALMRWGGTTLPGAAVWAGIILSVPALLLFGSVLHALGRNFSMSLTIKDEQTLITRGPYRFVRHPMYSSFVLLWFVFFLLSRNWFLGVTGLAAFALVMLVRTPREERMMLERFGPQYALYMSRTGRYLPTLRRKQSLDVPLDPATPAPTDTGTAFIRSSEP
jgi:protein-S-isoprenylcysteine O-methyltransferase Ste14